MTAAPPTTTGGAACPRPFGPAQNIGRRAMQPPSSHRQASSATMLPCHLATLRACPQDPHEAQPRLLQSRHPARHLPCPSFTRSALLLACVGQRIIRSIQPQAFASSRSNRLYSLSPSSTQTKTHVTSCHVGCENITDAGMSNLPSSVVWLNLTECYRISGKYICDSLFE